MIIEVKQWPEYKEVMDNPDWFFIMGTIPFSEACDYVYARVLDESEYILIKNIKDKYTFSEYVNLYTHPINNDGEPTTADEYNKEWLNEDRGN
jgi:hypothetical protein